MDIHTSNNIIAAVVGCTHGELDLIYNDIRQWEMTNEKFVDLLICCGDFEAVRNQSDLDCKSCPNKYRHFCDFYKYYNGECVASTLTIFIGGNHEAVNHNKELYYGGWAAPNIYFLGYSGVIDFGGLKISGISGIYKQYDYSKGHFETYPYDGSTVKSAFHVREYEIWKLKQLRNKIDVCLSHDWPASVIVNSTTQIRGQKSQALLVEDQEGQFGCPHYTDLIQVLKPDYWFSGHMHYYLEALIEHAEGNTHFLALDKTIKGRRYLNISSIGVATTEKVLKYDAEWLAILKASREYYPASHWFDTPPDSIASEIDTALEWINQNIEDLTVPHNFEITVQPYYGENYYGNKISGMPEYSPSNPQMESFVSLLEIDPFAIPRSRNNRGEKRGGNKGNNSRTNTTDNTGYDNSKNSGNRGRNRGGNRGNNSRTNTGNDNSKNSGNRGRNRGGNRGNNSRTNTTDNTGNDDSRRYQKSRVSHLN